MEGHTQPAGAVAGVTTGQSPTPPARAGMEGSKPRHAGGSRRGGVRHSLTQASSSGAQHGVFDTEQRRYSSKKRTRRKKPRRGPQPPGQLVRHRRRGRARPAGPHRRRHDHRRHDQQALRPGGRFADHRRRHLRGSALRRVGTGQGEYFIRHAVAHDICARVAYRGDSRAQAAEEVVDKLVPARRRRGRCHRDRPPRQHRDAVQHRGDVPRNDRTRRLAGHRDL